MSTNKMFLLILRFTGKQELADELMVAHMTHIQQGFAFGIFLIGGRIIDNQGGALVAHCVSREELERYVARDPFVEGGVVQAEIIEVDPLFVDTRIEHVFGRRFDD